MKTIILLLVFSLSATLCIATESLTWEQIQNIKVFTAEDARVLVQEKDLEYIVKRIKSACANSKQFIILPDKRWTGPVISNPSHTPLKVTVETLRKAGYTVEYRKDLRVFGMRNLPLGVAGWKVSWYPKEK